MYRPYPAKPVQGANAFDTVLVVDKQNHFPVYICRQYFNHFPVVTQASKRKVTETFPVFNSPFFAVPGRAVEN
jgi:hypothetical protein